jgi:ABC-2 type transport system permease protein
MRRLVAIAARSVREPLLFQRLRWRQLRNTARGLSRDSPLRLPTILLCSAVVWIGVFGVSLAGFRYVEHWIPFNGAIIGIVFNLMFLLLAGLLLFSSAIIIYSSLFSSAESAFLLSCPAGADQVFAYKFQTAVAYSSWAFVLLGSPILLGFGIQAKVEWPFYALLPLFFLGYVLLPGSVGALMCLLVVNFVPKRRKQVIVLAILAALAVIGVGAYQLFVTAQTQRADREMLNRLLDPFRFAQSPLCPSRLMASGLIRAGRGDWKSALYYLALVWSNGLFFYVVVSGLARRLYRRGYNRLATGGSLRRRYGGGWLDGGLITLVRFLDPQTRLLLVKDFRTFRREPSQWAQILILTGLMSFYFLNMRRFFSEGFPWPYRNGISLLNLCATGLLLSAYTGRFIYPMVSLEGRKFWILGLLPLRRERIVWGKFVFSATGGVVIAAFLVLLSDWNLEIPPTGVILHVLTVTVLAVGLSGLSVGLGAYLPNFRESDPSKIAVGFGGTLNLLVGLAFLILAIAIMAGPWHWSVAQSHEPPTGFEDLGWMLVVQVLLGLLLGAAAVVLPLRAGARALQRMEF